LLPIHSRELAKIQSFGIEMHIFVSGVPIGGQHGDEECKKWYRSCSDSVFFHFPLSTPRGVDINITIRYPYADSTAAFHIFCTLFSTEQLFYKLRTLLAYGYISIRSCMQYYPGYKIKKNGFRGACGTCWGGGGCKRGLGAEI
jgi:hypothetical protein